MRKLLNIEENRLPKFWEEVERLQEKKTGFKKDRFKIRTDDSEEVKEQKRQARNDFYTEDLACPMNTLYLYKFKKYRSKYPTLPNEVFFQKYELKEDRRKCRKIEELIEQYSWNLYMYNTGEPDAESYLLLKDDFDKMIQDIKQIHISNNYLGLMSYLIDRGLNITDAVKNKRGKTKSKLYKNQSLLLKTLYTISPQQFLQCFAKNVHNHSKN